MVSIIMIIHSKMCHCNIGAQHTTDYLLLLQIAEEV